MTPTTPRDDLLVSVCFAEAVSDADTLAQLTNLTVQLTERFRYWEILLIADADAAWNFDPLLAKTPNIRLLKVRRGTPFYRRRAAAASEAIGDVVVLGSIDELAALDIVAMIETAEGEASIVIGRRNRQSLINPALKALGGSAGFRVDSRDMLTAAYPRTLLNRLLAHPDRLLALRFPPDDHSIPVVWRTSRAVSAPARSFLEVGRRFNLIQRLLVSSAPRVLTLVALLSLAVIPSALAYAIYAVVVWLVLDTTQPGWLTTSLVLSLTALFLGFAIFGLSMGLQNVIEAVASDLSDDIVDERSSVDLFSQVMQELNVEIDAGRDAGRTVSDVERPTSDT